MASYLAGGLMVILLVAAAILGLEAYEIYDTARMVEAALLDGQARLAADGGVSPAVERQVRARVTTDGGDPRRVQVSGSRAGQAYGTEVALHVAYDHPYALTTLVPGGSGWRQGVFRVERSATTLSGWRP